MEPKRAIWLLSNFNSEGLFPVRPSFGLGYGHPKGMTRSELGEVMNLMEEMNVRIPDDQKAIKFYSLESALQKLANKSTIKFYEIAIEDGEEIHNIGNELNEDET